MIKKIGETVKRPGSLQASPELVEIQALMPMEPEDLERLRNDIRKNGIRDHLKIYTDRKTGLDLVLGGWNRLQIALELGTAEIKCDIYEGSAAERRQLVVDDNLSRRHLSAEQKRALIRYFLKQEPGTSARTVAKKTGTDHKTASRVRDDMLSRGEIPHVEKVTDTRGRQQPVKKAAQKPEPAAAPIPAGPLLADVKSLILKYIQSQKDPGVAGWKIIDFIKKEIAHEKEISQK